MEEAFKDYLYSQGYRDMSINWSCRLVTKIKNDLGYDWNQFAANIDDIISCYEKGGDKEKETIKVNRFIISSLNRFKKFINSNR